MNACKTVRTALKLVVIFSLVTGLSWAALASGNGRKDALAAASATVSLEQAVAAAMVALPGKAVRVEFSKQGLHRIWEIEILAEDQLLYEVEIDSKTAKVLDTEQEDFEEDENGNEQDNAEDQDDSGDDD